MTEQEYDQLVNGDPITPLVNLFDGWAKINGGKS
jgi:hypothetical protein